jgi:hypothetical protein
MIGRLRNTNITNEFRNTEDLDERFNPFVMLKCVSITEELICLDAMNKDMLQQLLVSRGVDMILFALQDGRDFIQLDDCTSPEVLSLIFWLLLLQMIDLGVRSL